jgi:aspartate racemase
MAKRIGILGGISAESTGEYYRRLTAVYRARRGDAHYPEIVIFSLDFQRFTDLENSGDEDAYVAEIMHGIHGLENADAELLIMAANSPHAVFDRVAAATPLPMLSIVQVTAERAKELGLKSLLLLGIKFTMQSDFYPQACARLGIDVLTPSPAEQNLVDRIIFDELARGQILPASREQLKEVIRRYPVDGVILGCTELPLILAPGDVELVLLDTLNLHVGATLDLALA